MKDFEKDFNRIHNLLFHLYSLYQSLTSIFTRYLYNLTISHSFHLFISHKSFLNRLLNLNKNKLL